jgi:SAM-dependent methyltransferase
MSQVGNVEYPKKDFWRNEGQKFVEPHHRLRKAARIVTRLAGTRKCDLLDLGCGPATLARLLPATIHYYGIDLAIRDPAPNLLESDLIENPIRFGDRRFDIVLAQGLFEYLEDAQDRKLEEIAGILAPGGTFVVSYTNFRHRRTELYGPYSNVRAPGEFRRSLEAVFRVQRQLVASHNWHHGQPVRPLTMALNMHVNLRIPIVTPRLAVEYFFVCSRQD